VIEIDGLVTVQFEPHPNPFFEKGLPSFKMKQARERHCLVKVFFIGSNGSKKATASRKFAACIAPFSAMILEKPHRLADSLLDDIDPLKSCLWSEMKTKASELESPLLQE